MISSYGDQVTLRIILHVIIASPTPRYRMLQRHHMFYTSNIRVTHRNGAIKHIFYESIHGGSSADCSLFILSLHALALHLADLKYYFKSFCMKDLTSTPYICRLYFPPEYQQDRTFSTPILLSENIPNICANLHQQNTRRSDQIETIKTIMQTRALMYHMEGFTNVRFAIFKKYSIKCEKI